MMLSAVEMLVFLGVIALAVLIARKSSWKALVAVPLAMLVLLGSFYTVWSVTTPRQVYHSPYDFVAPARVIPAYDPVFETYNSNAAPRRIEPQRSHSDYPRRWVFTLAAPLVIVVLAASIIVGRRLLTRNDRSVVKLFTIGGACLVLLALGGLLFIAGARFSAPVMRQAPAIALPPPPLAPPPPVAVAAADVVPVDPIDAATDTDAAATESPASPPPELPEWARSNMVEYRDLRTWTPRNPVVLVSDKWSSVPESEIQLEAMAARALQQQLQLDEGSSVKWRPSNDFIHQSGAIQRRFTRETTLKVGEFESPMYQTYWEVSATPHVSNLAQAAWKNALAEHRLVCLGGGAAGLTVLFASIAAGLRFDAASKGRHRRHLFAAAGVVTSMGAALLLFS